MSSQLGWEGKKWTAAATGGSIFIDYPLNFSHFCGIFVLDHTLLRWKSYLKRLYYSFKKSYAQLLRLLDKKSSCFATYQNGFDTEYFRHVGFTASLLKEEKGNPDQETAEFVLFLRFSLLHVHISY